ncbi:MAG TPA: ATPase, T2SS/T4P/T4SS family, partial [Rhodoferax sp.]|nr:ATPase, T2SS/T4P/T4SS family [Rhodoferax sp.]
MSSVMPQSAGERSSEQAFFESQKLPSQKRGMTFEALFYRQLHHVTARIHETENLEQIMLEASQDICKLLNADRLTLYAVNEDGTAIVSKIKTGLTSSRDLKLPISPQSIAGYVAYSKKPLNLPDVYDDEALKQIHPALTFLKEVDKRSGYRTRQMLVAPILEGKTLHGVLQVINSKSDEPFGELEIDGVAELCKTLATAIRQRVERSDDAPRKRATKYDGLVVDGLLTEAELNQCVQDARNQGKPVEHLLMATFKLKPSQIGPALSKFFSVPYEPFNPGRIRSEMLQGALKREFVVEQGWIPLEESPEGLVIMCTDPEAVRGSRVVPQVYPRITKFSYRVTTHAEFEETMAQLFGAAADGTSIDELLAGMDGAPIDDGMNDDSLESAAADNELVKFVNKVIIDAYHQKVSDIHIEPMPGKFKTGIRFRIDGTLQPYVEVPAHFRQAMVTRLKIMCDLDISERRKPQDGKIKFKKYGP